MPIFPRCCLALGLFALFPHPLPAAVPPAPTIQQLPYPEDEIARRRDTVNQVAKEIVRDTRVKAGETLSHPVPVPHALPLSGTLQISSGGTSTFYGKVRRELKYVIKERFVGNLIIIRYYDRSARKYTDREEYTIDTISLEIDASDFKGKVCNKYAGSPPTCSAWQELDLWQIGEGEDYPGKNNGVVSATSSGQTVNLRIDGPDILFASSQGGQGLKSGCGDLVQQQFSRDEFKRLIKRKTIKLTKELGKTVPGCRPGSTVTLQMEIGKEVR